METDSEPPSTMNLADLTEMAQNPPDSKAANLCNVPAQETIALPITSFSGANSPSESNSLIDYHATLQRRVGALLEYNLYTDVTFLAGPQKIPFKAHKLILSLASPVFAAMFNGNLPSEDEIEIPDCKASAFKFFLEFVYKDMYGEVTMEECVDVLYIARKYNIRGLEDACHVSLCNRLNEENVFDILSACAFYDIMAVSLLCWDYIEDHTTEILNYHMPELDTKTLTTILENDRLNISEIELFLFFDKWLEKECETKKLKLTGENKRKVANSLLRLIRFPTMTSAEFSDNVVPTGILSMEETANILTYITASPGRKPETGFSAMVRTPKASATKNRSRERRSGLPGSPGVYEYAPLTSHASRRRMASISRRRRH